MTNLPKYEMETVVNYLQIRWNERRERLQNTGDIGFFNDWYFRPTG